LLWMRKDISSVMVDPATDEATKSKLQLVVEILDFAAKELHLPVDETYSTYVSTGKPYVVWNVFAAPKWSLEMESFCYPIAGCVSYQGYFEKSKAHERASKLEDEGFDVFVGGVTAYSTLGWFADPVLDTFLMRSDLTLASLLFHELAHKVLYLSGDTQFNESFATMFSEEGLRRWLTYRGEETRFQDYSESRQRKSAVLTLIKASREELESLYASGSSLETMSVRKAKILGQLPADYKLLRKSWGGGSEFQGWMTAQARHSTLNNAKLGTIAEYNDWVPAFRALLSETDGDLELFLRSVKSLGQLDKPARDEALAVLLNAATKPT
jgi:predicted aminopeptidase